MFSAPMLFLRLMRFLRCLLKRSNTISKYERKLHKQYHSLAVTHDLLHRLGVVEPAIRLSERPALLKSDSGTESVKDGRRGGGQGQSESQEGGAK